MECGSSLPLLVRQLAAVGFHAGRRSAGASSSTPKRPARVTRRAEHRMAQGGRVSVQEVGSDQRAEEAPDASFAPAAADGWRSPVERPTLPEVFRTIPVPQGASLWRRFLALFGPGCLVAVGYMDRG